MYGPFGSLLYVVDERLRIRVVRQRYAGPIGEFLLLQLEFVEEGILHHLQCHLMEVLLSVRLVLPYLAQNVGVVHEIELGNHLGEVHKLGEVLEALELVHEPCV
jgi:hypothetical protein